MRITVLGSGSSGNATLVEAGDSRILVDAGLAARTVRKRARHHLGFRLEKLDGVLVTHAHADHAGHAATCGQVFDAPVFLTEATRRTVRFRHEPRTRVFGARASFSIGDIAVHPLPVPHDAPQVALVLEHAGVRVAIATDVGRVRADLVDHVRDCSVVLIESNYDPELLAFGPYPPAIQERVRCGTGHLSNLQTAELLRELGPATESVVLLHLSAKNNEPALARQVAREALGDRPVALHVADPDRPLSVSARPRGQLALPLIA